MKRIGRILAGLCGVCLLFAGCNTTETTDVDAAAREEVRAAAQERGYALYQEVMENRQTQASVDSTTTGTVVWEDEESRRFTLELTADLKLAGDPNNPQVYKDVKIEGGAYSNAYTLYIVDGYRYYADDKQKFFERTTDEKATAEAERLNLVGMTSAAFEQTTIIEKESGISVSADVDGERLEGVLMQEDALLPMLLGDKLQTEEDVSLKGVWVQFEVNNDHQLTSWQVRYTVEQTIDGVDSTVKAEFKTEIHNPAAKVEISFPDFDEYEDKSAGNVLDQESMEALPDVLEQLFDDEGKRVDAYDARYAQLCEKYAKEEVDAVIAWYETYLQTQTPAALG